MRPTAKLERNVCLIDNVGSWGINSVPLEAFSELAPRILVQWEQNGFDLCSQLIANATEKQIASGVWFGVPPTAETALDYARRISNALGALAPALDHNGGEALLDLESNWGRQKILDAVTYIKHGWTNPDRTHPELDVRARTRTLSVTCEPQQDWTVFPWAELYALGVAAVYIQCYGATMADLRDPLYCVAVALGSNVPLDFVKVMIPAARPDSRLRWNNKDVGRYCDRIPMTGTTGFAFYLADYWGQPAADPAKLNADIAAYAPLIGGPIPAGKTDRRATVSAYK